MKTIVSLLMMLWFSLYAEAQQIRDREVKSQLEYRGEVYLSVDIVEYLQKTEDFASFNFDKIEGDRVFFYASKKEFKKKGGAVSNFKIEPIESQLFEPRMLKSAAKFSNTWDAYPTYEQYDSLMLAFASQYPKLCRYHVVGSLTSSRQLIALELGDRVYENEGEVRFLYLSSLHGNETTGYVLMLRLIEYLLDNFGVDDQVTRLMNNVEIWIIPLANPDGAYFSGNHTVYGATRYNANSVDLNRNYPDPEDSPHPDGKVYQPETEILMAFADSMQFNVSATIHTGAEVVNYPWDTWAKLHADDNWWAYVSKKFADSARYHSPDGYLDMFGTGYTNGYQWYSVAGSRQDYLNYYQHCREVTLEISKTKLLPEGQLRNHWNYLYRSFLNYMEEATKGVQGRVTDSLTSKPLYAKLEILNHDMDGSEVFTNDSGFYYRPIATGSYDLQFSAEGYYSKTLQNVQLFQDSAVNHDVQLVPNIDGLEQNNHAHLVELFPNPATFSFKLRTTQSIHNLEVFDALGNSVQFQKRVRGEELEISTRSWKRGLYYLRFRIGEQTEVKKLLIQ